MVTLVCKSWRDAFYSEPGLWSAFILPAPAGRTCGSFLLWPDQKLVAWAAAQLALLQRVAPLVSAMECNNSGFLQYGMVQAGLPWSPADLLGQLPATLTRLSFSSWSDSLPPSLLAAFSLLRSLSLDSSGFDDSRLWAPAMLESICSMRQLTELSLNAHHLPSELLAALAGRLPQLRRLSVHGSAPLQHAQQLVSCTGLEHLLLWESNAQQSGLQPPAQAQLPNLQTYDFTIGAGSESVGETFQVRCAAHPGQGATAHSQPHTQLAACGVPHAMQVASGPIRNNIACMCVCLQACC